ncbi:MAG: hypothetical protein HWE22_00495 [Flavobacteriales bacterium]|nr:hypothetical protein [Flavobacteriales bacterium]
MKQVLYILQFCFFSLLFLSSSTPLVKKDALDSIGLYQGDELVGKWREFDDPVLVEILLNSENDTLLFHCSSDVRWMNSSSLFLTVNQLTRKDLFLSFDDSTNYSERFILPTSRISRDIETLEVWRQTKNHKQIIFQLTIQRKGEALSQCECLDSVYLLKKNTP